MKVIVLALILILVPVKMQEAPVPLVYKQTTEKVVKRKPVVRHSDSQCLVSAIYHEARGEPLEGQRAVYEVIMHRAKALGKSLCAVVKAPRQFSWYGEPDKPIMPFDGRMRAMLERVKHHPSVLGSIKFRWFFSGNEWPYWAKKMECHIVIGGHRFCKEKEEE